MFASFSFACEARPKTLVSISAPHPDHPSIPRSCARSEAQALVALSKSWQYYTIPLFLIRFLILKVLLSCMRSGGRPKQNGVLQHNFNSPLMASATIPPTREEVPIGYEIKWITYRARVHHITLRPSLRAPTTRHSSCRLWCLVAVSSWLSPKLRRIRSVSCGILSINRRLVSSCNSCWGDCWRCRSSDGLNSSVRHRFPAILIRTSATWGLLIRRYLTRFRRRRIRISPINFRFASASERTGGCTWNALIRASCSRFPCRCPSLSILPSA